MRCGVFPCVNDGSIFLKESFLEYLEVCSFSFLEHVCNILNSFVGKVLFALNVGIFVHLTLMLKHGFNEVNFIKVGVAHLVQSWQD